MSISHYLNTSVSDAKISLELRVKNDPAAVASDAIALLEHLQGDKDHTSRVKMLGTILRKAARAIADDQNPDPHGPLASDMYATLPAADLRNVLDCRIETDPGAAAEEMLKSLVSLRGEPQCETRRRILVAAIGRAAKAMQHQPQEMPA